MTASKAGETPTLAENVHRAFTECNHLRIENAELLNSIEAPQAKLAAAERDAGRYRWIRANCEFDESDGDCGEGSLAQEAWNILLGTNNPPGKLDAAIDAAIAALRRSAP